MITTTIKDLIFVPPVETVIQLEDAQLKDRHASQKLLTPFVITDEIHRVFQELFSHVSRQQGIGAFLKGNYGSGKSHLLAVLSLLLQSPDLWQFINHPLLAKYQNIQEQKILPIRIALHNFAAGEKLESIFFEEVEKSLQDATGESNLLRSGAVLIEDFNRYFLPQHPEFLSFIGKDKDTWQSFCRTHTRQAAGQIYTFVIQQQIPLRPTFDRRQALNLLTDIMNTHNYSGIFFAVDELSEFLKSKTNSADFTEDLRFLQFIGEACKHNPFYIIASLQENIEKTGYIEKDLVYRIKDRYPLRFSLSSRHVNQLISKRLIHKREDAVPQIHEIYQQFYSAFPKLETGKQAFTDIFPVHPDTVNLLEGLTPLFSQHRGVVDFIYHQLTGDSNRHWEGMMNLPAEKLMTPDTIFDHFHTRISEISDLSPFVEVVFKTLQREIPQIFEEQKDRDIALKAVKILILIELSPLEKRINVERLAQMINEPVSDLDETLNYSYLNEVILEKLINQGSFISRKTDDSGDTIYFVSLEMTVHQMVRNRLNEALKQTPAIEKEAAQLFDYLKNSQLPLSLLSTNQQKKFTINWQNTSRQGRVIYKPKTRILPAELDELKQELTGTETDFVLYLATPLSGNFPDHSPLEHSAFEGRFAKVILFWIPRPFNEDEAAFIHQFYAHNVVQQNLQQSDNPQDRQMRQIVGQWMTDHQQELTNIIEDVYYGGRLADCEGWKSYQFMPFYTDFKTLLKQIFSEPLQELFPRHGEIMPGDAIPAFAVEKLFTHFIRPGTIDRSEANVQHIDKLIETCLKPLGIVETDKDYLSLSVSSKENSLLEEVLNNAVEGQPASLYALYWQLRKSEWGITKPQFQLLIAALITSGKLSAFQSGSVVPFRNIQQLTDGSIDAVGQGKLVNEVVQSALKPLLKLPEFSEISPHFSTNTQEQVWRIMKGFRQDTQNLRNEWQNVSERYQTYPAYKELVETQPLDLPLLEDFENALRVSYPAKEGLEKLANELQPQRLKKFGETLGQLKELIQFLRTRFVELNQIYVYLKNFQLKNIASQLTAEQQNLLNELYKQMQSTVIWDDAALNRFTQKFYQFRSDYISSYLEAHRNYYNHPVFKEPEKITATPQVQILKRLHRLDALAFSPDWITIRGSIGKLPKPCREQPERQLTTAPVCKCGFIPGEQLPESQMENILQLANTGVKAALNQLKNTFRWALEEYTENLKQVGQPDLSQAILNILNFSEDRVDNNPQNLLVLVTDNVIDAMNEGIHGKVLILQRSISDLQEQLAGRQKTVKEIREVINNWLKGEDEINEDTHIRVLGEQEYPEFDALKYQGIRHCIREEGIRFYEAFWLFYWAAQHQKQEWFDWIKNRYRIQDMDLGLLNSIARDRLTTAEGDRFLLYAERTTILSQLEKYLDFHRKSVEALLQFILQETFVEPLSWKAVQTVITKIAPTEPLHEKLYHFPENLNKHPHLDNWSHLKFFEKYLSLLQKLTDGERAEDLMGFYLRQGWNLVLLLDSANQRNQTINFLSTERHQLLAERCRKLQDQLKFPVQNFAKREIPFPYFSLTQFPQRLCNLIRENDAPVITFIVDAMRWDVWERLRPFFIDWLPQHHLNFIGALEVASPTTTEKNRSLIIDQMADITQALTWRLETVSEDPSQREKIINLVKNNGGLLFLNTTILDRLLHERKEPLTAIMEVLKTRMETLIKPILGAIPGNATIVLTADHGFLDTGSDFPHGGDSFFEKIVPFTVWRS